MSNFQKGQLILSSSTETIIYRVGDRREISSEVSICRGEHEFHPNYLPQAEVQLLIELHYKIVLWLSLHFLVIDEEKGADGSRLPDLSTSIREGLDYLRIRAHQSKSLQDVVHVYPGA